MPAILAVVPLTALPLIVAYAYAAEQERIIKGMMASSIKSAAPRIPC